MQNESQLANTVFKIEPNKADSFFCFLLFVQSVNYLYLWNQLPNLWWVFTILKPKQYPKRKCQKNKKSYFLTSDSFCLITSHITKYIFLCTGLGICNLKSRKGAGQVENELHFSLQLNIFFGFIVSLKDHDFQKTGFNYFWDTLYQGLGFSHIFHPSYGGNRTLHLPAISSLTH